MSQPGWAHRPPPCLPQIFRHAGSRSAVWMRAALSAIMSITEGIATRCRGRTPLLLTPGATAVFPTAVVSIDCRLITARLNTPYAPSVGLTAKSWCAGVLQAVRYRTHLPASHWLSWRALHTRVLLSSHNPRLQLRLNAQAHRRQHTTHLAATRDAAASTI